MDIRPVNPGHLLVIPLVHAAGLTTLESDTGAQMFRVGQRLAEAIRRSGVRCEGINFLLADGEAAGQEVFHVHLHVIPRYAGDGFGFRIRARFRRVCPIGMCSKPRRARCARQLPGGRRLTSPGLPDEARPSSQAAAARILRRHLDRWSNDRKLRLAAFRGSEAAECRNCRESEEPRG